MRPILFAGDSWAALQSCSVKLILSSVAQHAIIYPGSSSEELLDGLTKQSVPDDCVVVLSIGYGDIQKKGMPARVTYSWELSVLDQLRDLGCHHILQVGYNLAYHLFTDMIKQRRMRTLDLQRQTTQRVDYSYHSVNDFDALMTMGPDGVHLTGGSYARRTCIFGTELRVRVQE